MVAAVILTFVITSLAMLTMFLWDGHKRQLAENKNVLKENDGLRRQIAHFEANEHYRRECRAYDKGLYDGRSSDEIYRNILKKFTNREQAKMMLNEESEGNKQ